MQADLDPLLIPGASNVWDGFSDLVRLDTASNAASNRPIVFDVNTRQWNLSRVSTPDVTPNFNGAEYTEAEAIWAANHDTGQDDP